MKDLEMKQTQKLARKREPHIDPTTAAVIALATKAIAALTTNVGTVKGRLIRLLHLSASRDLQRLRKVDPKFDARVFLREENGNGENKAYLFGRARALFDILDIFQEEDRDEQVSKTQEKQTSTRKRG